MIAVSSRVLSCLLVACPLLLAQDPGALRLAGIFGDHMVLPRGQARMFGSAAAGATVVVAQPGGGEARAVAGADGRWACAVATGAAGGPYEVAVICGDQRLLLRDVLVGDVWLGSGQSNMEMPVGNAGWWKTGVANHEQEIAAADHPRLRLFTVANAIAAAPAADVRGTWSVCSPATVAAFSATAYFFGRELLTRLDRPIGLVASCWGGTVCEAWTSAEGLREFPEFGGAVTALAERARETPAGRDERRLAYWRKVAALDPAATVEGWQPVALPHLWSKALAGDFDGVGFYRCTVEIPAAWAGRELRLQLPAIDDMDTVWLGDRKVGGIEDTGGWATPRTYGIPAEAAVAGRHVLRVRVVDTGGEGGINGATATLAPAAGDAPPIALTGWQWLRGAPLRELPAFPSDQGGNPNVPTVLWNGMIAPLVPFPFTGVIWYQGESNRGRDEQYARLFPAMIRDWRRAFGRELPFYFVQIAPFHYGDSALETPRLRAAQAAALALPQTGMVVTMDIGDPRDIHPRDKQSVGRRLALQALARTLGQDIVCDGPRLAGAEAAGAVVTLAFTATGALRAAGGTLAGFEVAGANGAFVPATAVVSGRSVELRAADVAVPVAVRYGWHEDAPATLTDDSGLPAWPFERSLDR